MPVVRHWAYHLTSDALPGTTNCIRINKLVANRVIIRGNP